MRYIQYLFFFALGCTSSALRSSKGRMVSVSAKPGLGLALRFRSPISSIARYSHYIPATSPAWRNFYLRALRGASALHSIAPKGETMPRIKMNDTREEVLKSAVRAYTNDWYMSINHDLRLKSEDTLSLEDKVTAENVCLGMWTYGEMPPEVVYRGISGRPFSTTDVGTVVRFKGFTSTSTALFLADKIFADGQLLTIRLDPERTGARKISKMSHFPREKEVLFPPHAEFKVVSFDKGVGSEHDKVVIEEIPCEMCKP